MNELGRSAEDINDLSEFQPKGYFHPKYNMKDLTWNEVLIQRVSPNWCDSWGRQSSKWVEDDGAGMCVQSDDDNEYCMDNGEDKHTWRVRPSAHFACGLTRRVSATSASTKTMRRTNQLLVKSPFTP